MRHWPAAAFWPEISAAYVDPSCCFSTRSTAEQWYRSASSTIFAVDPTNLPGAGVMDDFIPGMFERFTPDIQDPEAAMGSL